MSTALHPCESCTRHVRLTSVVCPFCSAVLSDAFRATTPRALPASRLSRAATYALGAALAAGTACGGSPAPAYGGPPTTPPTTVQPQPPDVVVAPAYGGPPQQVTAPPTYDDGNVQPMYGVAPEK